MDTQPARLTRFLVATLFAVSCLTAPAMAQDRLAVISVKPDVRSLDAELRRSIKVRFDRPLDRSSVTEASFWAFGRWSGVAQGKFKFLDGGRTVKLFPARQFSAGEMVTVVLSDDLRALDGTTLGPSGHSFQFWTKSRGAGFDFTETGRFSTRSSPAVSTRSYGGFGSDLDGDGFLDLTIVNEDTNDLRTFLNRGDRSGTFRDFLRPTSRAGSVPSPSEPTDFDRDGQVDVVVANTQDDSVSVFLGRGDGTFRRPDHYTVGGEPRGVTVLDADGDGAMDIAATSFVAGTVTVLFNDSEGGFDRTEVFGTSSGERAIAAADMNEDGILDLVVGALSAERIDIYTGDGDGHGTFSLASSQDAGGQVWMLVLGDVNGDGSEDVAAVNGQSNNAAILIGDGNGGLAPPVTIATDPFPLATDLGDLDGDGDLDWVTSSFSGDWLVFENDGIGGFTRTQSHDAAQAASCSLAMDVDNDGALDLVLIDELEDEVVVMQNTALVFESDFESGDLSRWSKSRGLVRVVQPGLRDSGYAMEVVAQGEKAFVARNFFPSELTLGVSFDLDLRGFEPGTVGDRGVEILTSAGEQVILTLTGSGNKRRVHLYAPDWPQNVYRKVGSTRVPVSGPVRLGIEWAPAGGPKLRDGRAALLKNGRIKAVLTGLDHFSRPPIWGFRVGLQGQSGRVIEGSLLFDNVRWTR